MIAWFARNGVAANLLMLFIFVGGAVGLWRVKVEMFPAFELESITVTVAYPGAAPEEVESGVGVLIEEELAGLEGIKKVTVVAAEGFCRVVVDVAKGYGVERLLNQVKVRVDAMEHLPLDALRPVVEAVSVKRQVLSVAVYGDLDEGTLKRLAERVREDLVALEGVSQVEVYGVREDEVAIEVSELALRAYGLTFDDVVRALKQWSVDVPGGVLRTQGGEILLRGVGRAYWGGEFEEIVLVSARDGARVPIGAVCRVVDGFVDKDMKSRFNGKPAVFLSVFEVGAESPLEISRKVKAYVAGASAWLPEGVEMRMWSDVSHYLLGRLNMLNKNALMGLVLVFVTLALFLRPTVAFWVMMGIPVSFFGMFLMMPWLDVSVNLLSLFAFILVLGIVVDDAIVVGESVFTRFQRDGGPSLEGAIEGTRKVALPVTFSVLTTMAAFAPLLFLPGTMGRFLRDLPIIVILTLAFSLIESKLILPYHLSLCPVGSGQRERLGWLMRVQRRVADGLEVFVQRYYEPLLAVCLRWRYVTVAVFVGMMVVTLGLLAGGVVKLVISPKVESDYVIANVVMPEGTAFEGTAAVMERLSVALGRVLAEAEAQEGRSVSREISLAVGQQGFGGDPMGVSVSGGGNLGQMIVELVKAEERTVSASTLVARWREAVGPVAGVRELTFQYTAGPAGKTPLEVQLTAKRFEDLREAVVDLREGLAAYPGVFAVRDSYPLGKSEVKIRVRPEAVALGVTQWELSRQVRQAFHGEEALRMQRGRDDVRVMVRLPQEDRRSVDALEGMWVRLPDGRAVPFEVAADLEWGRGYASITRVDGRRAASVSCDVDGAVANVEEVRRVLLEEFLPGFERRHPGVRWSLEGESRDNAETMEALRVGFVFSLMLIYVLLAIPFRSYLQPFIVMCVIPFGLVGAIWGHWLLGYPLSMFSMYGLLALAGVVVNDSLVLVDFINGRRAEGVSVEQAVQEAGGARFRPVLLTSLTTFVGLMPIIFERSLQAQFMIPMAVSLGFGVLFATAITLFQVPAAYLILEECQAACVRGWRWCFPAPR